MNDIYQLLYPIFTSETVTSAIRQAGLVRQAHLAAGLRKEPPSSTYGMSVLKAQHRFMESLCEAFMESDLPDEVYDAIGYHSFMFAGTNPRVMEMLYLAVSGETEFSLDRLKDILQVPADIDDIIRGKENPVDTLRWLAHTGNSFAMYLVKLAN